MKKFYHTLSAKLKSSSQKDLDVSTPNSYQSPTPAAEEAKVHLIYTDPHPTLDIIAIHGLATSHHSPWATSFTSRTTGCSWLRDLLPPFFHAQSPSISVRVFVFGYVLDESVGLEDVVSRLGEEVLSWGVAAPGHSAGIGHKEASAEKKDNGARKVLWLAHSFGGGLLKGFLSARPEVAEIVGEIRGVLLFGVPRASGGGGNEGGFIGLGTALANQDAGKGTGTVAGENSYVKKLREEAQWLAQGAEDFDRLCKRREAGRVVYFLETTGEDVVVGRGRDSAFEVEDSAGDTKGFDGEIGGKRGWEGNVKAVQTTKGHGAMIRFDGREDGEWKRVERVLLELKFR